MSTTSSSVTRNHVLLALETTAFRGDALERLGLGNLPGSSPRIWLMNGLYPRRRESGLMRASTRVEYPKLVRQVEKSLKSLDYPFLRNETKLLTEFEVLSPCGFRVIVESNSREDYSFGFIHSQKNESSLELRRALEVQESNGLVKRQATAFMERLTSALPEKPWKGLGLIRSRTERTKWSLLAEI